MWSQKILHIQRHFSYIKPQDNITRLNDDDRFDRPEWSSFQICTKYPYA